MTFGIDGSTYDRVFVGTSMISVLDAVYHSRCGKSVLMIDNQPSMGGAWRSLDVFGLHDVENAIHYLLPEPKAVRFMKNTLGWGIIESPRKYRIFCLPGFGRCRLPYDSALGRVVGRSIEIRQQALRHSVVRSLLAAIREVWTNARQPSVYVEGGSPEMLRKTAEMLATAAVDVVYSTQIDQIVFDPHKQQAVIHTNAGVVRTETVVVSHGTKIEEMRGPAGKVDLVWQVHPRPAVHLLVRDVSPTSIYECVFTGDPLIKYAHDITRFTREAGDIKGSIKVIVLALRNDIKKADEIYAELLKKLQWAGMLGRTAVLEDSLWSDIMLPAIDDSDLARMKSVFGAQVDCLRTENFSAGVGYYAPRWSQRLQPLAAPRPTRSHQEFLTENRKRV